MEDNALRLGVYCDCDKRLEQADTFSKENGCTLHKSDLDALLTRYDYILEFSEENLALVYQEGKKVRRLSVNFISGAKNHRRKYGGGKGQAVAKAVGLHNASFLPSVLDATAGQGGDAFVLAALGCEVHMLERSPVAYALLCDAMHNGRVYAQENDQELKEIFARMHLQQGNFLADSMLKKMPREFDVVYLDPMFPERKKSALVKKEMRIFHDVIGKDVDADQLLEKALGLAKFRAVVKRPIISPFLAGEKPSYQLKGKSSRYDIYVNKTMR